MKKYNSSFKNAIQHVRKIKPNVCPNLGFQLQLKNYQNNLNLGLQDQDIPKLRSNKFTQKVQSASEPYVFQIPIHNKNHHDFKNIPKILNRAFNKTHGSKIYKKT